MPAWTHAPETPFSPVPRRIPLDPDLLVSVAAQVRFAPVLSVRDQEFVAPFQEAIRQSYPLAERQIQQQVMPGASGMLQLAESVLWAFSDPDENWQVVLSETFVTLRCSDYSNREDFLSRLREVLDAVGAHVQPVLTSRVGVQYTDRLSGEDLLGRLPEMVRSQLLGLASTGLVEGEVVNELTQAEFSIDNVRLRGRWGHLPANSTLDMAVEAVDAPSWILDLDAFTEASQPFDPGNCAAEAERCAGIVYGFFRWAVSDEFLTSHGAEL